MKISVITVAFNAAHTIGDAVRSVRAQAGADYEHIIIDGASTDGTLQVLSALQHDRLRVISEPDKGIFDAMNKGAQAATGDLVGFLNADDFFCRRDALRLVSKAAERTSHDAIAGAVLVVERDRIERVVRLYKARGFRPWMLRFSHMPPHPGLYARRAALALTGPFDPALTSAADFDWLVRFFLVRGLKAEFLSEALVAMRSGGNSQTAKGRAEGWRDCITSLRRHDVRGGEYLLWAKYPAKLMQFAAMGRAWPVDEAERWRPN